MAGFVSVAEAAALLGFSESTVRRRVDSGDLPAFRFGDRKVKIPVTGLVEYVAKCRSDGGDVLVKGAGGNSDLMRG